MASIAPLLLDCLCYTRDLSETTTRMTAALFMSDPCDTMLNFAATGFEFEPLPSFGRLEPTG
jgi:hypothetical protein